MTTSAYNYIKKYTVYTLVQKSSAVSFPLCQQSQRERSDRSHIQTALSVNYYDDDAFVCSLTVACCLSIFDDGTASLTNKQTRFDSRKWRLQPLYSHRGFRQPISKIAASKKRSGEVGETLPLQQMIKCSLQEFPARLRDSSAVS